MKTTHDLDGGLSITIEQLPDDNGAWRITVTGGTAYMDITRPGEDGAVFYAMPGNAIHERPPKPLDALERAMTDEAWVERCKRRTDRMKGKISL